MATRKSTIERFENKVVRVPFSGCWIWTARVNACGYGTIKVSNKSVLAHRLSHELFIGKIPESLVVMHSCDTPCCVNPDHLSCGTVKENTHDMIRKRRDNRGVPKSGENHPHHKLTASQVLEIRENKYCLTHASLAIMYRTSVSLIGLIILRKRWKHI